MGGTVVSVHGGDRPETWSEALALAMVVAVAAGLRLWRLDQNGWDNEYYAAAVRSMAVSLHNFLYNAFDPAGFVSVDKPPVALWIQVLGVKLLGFQGVSVLLPQVVEGLGAVLLAYHLVRRASGPAAGLLAALFLALTPVSVAVDRSGNTESCLVLVLLLAAWALLRAAEEGRLLLLVLAMALIGLAFNVKMLAAFVVVPAFMLVYLLGAPVSWRRRLVDLSLAGIVLVAVSLPWIAAYDLTPADRRPFAGSSRGNSMLELAVSHNGLGRFVQIARSSPEGVSAVPRARPAVEETAASAWWSRLFVRAPVGPLRLADGQLAAQAGWLLPLALAGLLAGLGRGGFRLPLAPARLALILWGGWALTCAVIFSYAGGIFHFYYLSMVAPPLAALAGTGVVALWNRHLAPGRGALVLPVVLVLAAAWQVYVECAALGWTLGQSFGARTMLATLAGRSGDWRTGLHVGLVGGVAAAVAALVATRPRGAAGQAARRAGAAALSVGVAALLVIPVAWALSSVVVKGIAVLPAADLVRLGPDAQAGRAASTPASVRRLVDFLRRHRAGERYLLATTGTRLAAPIIIETGEPVMAMGGFHGLDPILTPESLAHLAATRQLRFVMLGDLSLVSRRMGGEVASRPIAAWVREHGTLIDPDLWRSTWRPSPLQLYDLRPDTAGERP